MNDQAPAEANLAALAEVLQRQPELEFAVLVGSRANGTATAGSDWDIAIRWQRGLNPVQRLEATESLRLQLSQAIAVPPEAIDLIDLVQARLAMRALVAEEGRVLAGENGLPWMRFLQTTWAEIEDFHWRQQHPPRFVHRAQVRRWREENADFIAAYNATLETEGLPLEGCRCF